VRNVIINGLPSTVEVGGASVEVNTDFRHCLQVSLLVDDPTIPEDVKLKGIVWHMFAIWPDVTTFGEYLDAARDFLKLGELDTRITRRPRKSREKTFDWDEDQKRLVADFMREYRIDLTDESTELHWWMFLALFENLSGESATMKAIGVRAMEIPKGATDKERARIRELKKQYELAPRSREELEARERAIWGD
jgi:hypothetical protein